MQTTHIKFLTEEDRVRGFFELATRSQITSFPGEIYQVPLEAIRLLDDGHIQYRRAMDIEVRATSPDQVKNSLLQRWSTNATKHALTLFHCLLAAVITPLGLALAADQTIAHPIGSRFMAFGAVILPVFIATRVAWRAGYEAGRRS
jgi:hypothetical protein